MVNKMNGESVDLTAQNIARLKELFPEILTDGEKIDFDMLKAVLGGEVDSENERYQFTWHGKKQMILGTQKPSKGTLRPDKEKSKNFDTTENLYIEGDNLEVLKLLQKSYNNKIKMIYIDPPYNTGKDFVYKDNFKDGVQNYLEQTGQVDSEGNILSTNSESNGRFHTDWLNMMYSRIKLAKNLLRNDGGIFISIDNNELKNLLKICDEIFGEENFIGQIAVVNNLKGRNDSKNLATAHEYLVIYGKGNFELNGLPLTEEKIAEYDQTDENGEKYQLRDLRKRGRPDRREDRPNMYYPIYYNEITGECSLEEQENSIVIFPIKGDGTDGRWRWGKERTNRNLHRLVPHYSKTKDKWGIKHKIYLNNNLNDNDTSEDNEDDEQTSRTIKSKSFWMRPEHSTDVASRQIKNIFTYNIFDYPKPIDFVKDVILLGSKEGDYILDFFSGSATTAHATMQLNAEDDGNRKFIMVQLPEVLDEKSEAYKDGYCTICDIGEERIRRAGEMIKAELGEKQQKSGMLDENVVDPESLDIGFKVLKLDTSNIREWNVDFDNLEDALDLYDTPFIEGRSELDVVYEIMLKQGLELTYPIETFDVNGQTVYDIGFGSLFICLSQKITADIAQAIIARRDEHGTDTSSVIFSDAGFATDSDKLNCIEILKDAGYPEDNLLTL